MEEKENSGKRKGFFRSLFEKNHSAASEEPVSTEKKTEQKAVAEAVDEVAAAAGYHPTYFSQLFSAVTGETYIDMLTRLRLGHAKSMLANGFSVSDSCFQSGFGSLSNFLEIFKRKCKTTPNEYRKKALKTR